MSHTSTRPWVSREPNQMERKERVGEKVGGNRASYAPFQNQEAGHASDVTKTLSAAKVSSKIVGLLCPTPNIHFSGRLSLILMQKNNSMFFVCFISLMSSSKFEETLMGKMGNIIQTSSIPICIDDVLKPPSYKFSSVDICI